MSKSVLDASALLAYLNNERGASTAAGVLEDEPVMSAVNLSEVASKLVDAGIDVAEVNVMLDGLQMEVIAFDADAAYEVAALRPVTRKAGLSLGDRACMVLGLRLEIPVVTADQTWRNLPVPVEVILLR